MPRVEGKRVPVERRETRPWYDRELVDADVDADVDSAVDAAAVTVDVDDVRAGRADGAGDDDDDDDDDAAVGDAANAADASDAVLVELDEFLAS